MPSQASAFTIEEITGQLRRLSLRGRALPYRPVSWSGTMRTKVTWYPGNPEATIQVLGPEEEPTSIEGTWKDRFLPGQVEQNTASINSFGTISTAEAMVQAMHELRRTGQALRVQWGPEVRYGILRMFDANYERIEDVRWRAEFQWFSRDEERAPRATAEPTQVPDMRTAVNEVDDELAFEPPLVEPDFAAQLLTSIADMRADVGVVFDRVRQVQALVSVPSQVLGALASAVESIRAETEDEFGRLLDVPSTTVTASDRLSDVLAGEVWRRNMGRRMHRMRATAQRVERAQREKARPGAVAIVTVPADVTLRQLAQRVYGDADSWQLIADLNGFTTSVVSAGTVVVVPPRPSEVV